MALRDRVRTKRLTAGEVIDGSPLRVLKLIASHSTFSAKVSTVFIEADPVLFSALDKCVADFAKANSQIRTPSCAVAHSSKVCVNC